jgi:hypothetical protein
VNETERDKDFILRMLVSHIFFHCNDRTHAVSILAKQNIDTIQKKSSSSAAATKKKQKQDVKKLLQSKSATRHRLTEAKKQQEDAFAAVDGMVVSDCSALNCAIVVF